MESITAEQVVNREMLRVEDTTMCSAMYNANVSQIEVPAFTHITDVVIGPPRPVADDAVCVFHRRKLYLHFAHAMQQLYACWSYWQENSDKNPVLLVKSETEGGVVEQLRYRLYSRRNRDNPFMTGLMRSLRRLGVKIFVDDDSVSTKEAVTSSVLLDGQFHHYPVLPESNKKLRDKLVYGSGSCHRQPRVGILNREKSRSLQNVGFIRSYLERFLGLPVSIAYFEKLSFHEQIQWMSSIDILISPHGAQLTGIAFMPDCGSILEIFPNNYLDPFLFGTLANASGLEHFYIYLSDTNIKHEQVIAEMRHQDSESKARRNKSRNVDLCPTRESILDATRLMISRWQQCCEVWSR